MGSLMAVVTPTTISTGMENGPETIDQNFKAITAQTNSERTTSWVAITPNTNNTTGKLFIRRKGDDVELAGQVTLKKAGSGTNSPGIFTIPTGYLPASSSDGRSSFKTAFDFGGTGLLKAQLAGSQFVAISGSAGVAFQVNWGWDTSDDFPA